MKKVKKIGIISLIVIIIDRILKVLVTNNFVLNVRNKIIAYSRQVIMKAEKGINIPFYNIIEMEKILLNK